MSKGIRVRKSAVRVFCARHEIQPYRPTDPFLQGNPAKQARSLEELADLKGRGEGRASAPESGRRPPPESPDAVPHAQGQWAPADGRDEGQQAPPGLQLNHNPLFQTIGELKRSLRASLCYYRTATGRVRSHLADRRAPPNEQTASTGL
jgi:hypothetical protein